MRVHIVAVGTRMPEWVSAGYNEYARRMPRECQLELAEVQLSARDRARAPAERKVAEADALRGRLPRGGLLVALDERGTAWSTEQLKNKLNGWMGSGQDVALVIGGADGLDSSLKKSADMMWSLSPLTLPHGMVRIVLAEQLYRAWSMLNNHPYHRA
ncbi:MAG: 23S rRNA (pseudouridine(1915)-N(3))-methyltransferase RlmH [Pseudomonadota bacterium]